MNYPNFKVFVRCSTFNHSKYIIDAMNGFVMQETNFPFLCCIIDDMSTDGEQDVIRQYVFDNFDLSENSQHYDRETDYAYITYAQHKNNKNCFFIVYYLKQNHYSIKKKKLPYFKEWREMCTYEALCEGDDYWICPYKLQKQADILDNDSTLSVCTHAYYKLIDSQLVKYREDLDSDFRYNVKNSLQTWITQPLTSMYRIDCLPSPETTAKYSLFQDNHLYYYLLKKGDGYNVGEYMGVYRITGQGIYTSLNGYNKIKIELLCYSELCDNNPSDKELRIKLMKMYYAYVTSSLANRKLPKLLPVKTAKLSGYAYFLSFLYSHIFNKVINIFHLNHRNNGF